MLEPSVQHDPLVAAGSHRQWRAWARFLLGAARARLGGASLLVLGALALGAAALWLFGSVASEMAEGETQQVDDAVLLWLRRYSTPALDDAARIATAFGSEVLVVLLVASLLCFAAQRRWGAAGSLALVTAGAQLLNNVLKEQFQRVRPSPVAAFIPAQQWSFPSGHATVAAAFYLFLAYLGWRLLTSWARFAWAGALIALVVLIDLTRLYLGVHYVSDVVAGNAVGAAWAAAVVAAGNLVAARGHSSTSPG